MQNQNEIAHVAVQYAERGWHLFPVPPGTKKSYLAAKFSDNRKWGATADVEQVKRIFAEFPEANVGIVCGPLSGFFVVEADTLDGHNVDGVSNFNALIEKHGPLPETITAHSPSGSVHYYFRWPEGASVANSASQIAQGVDVRGDGGMVVAAPSVKPGAPMRYRWTKSPETYDLADCPDWLLEMCLKPKKLIERQEDASLSGLADAYQPNPSEAHWAATALQEELAAVTWAQEGKRNAQLNKSAFSLAQIVSAGLLDWQTVAVGLTKAALAAGLGAAETHATIESGMTAGAASPRGPSSPPKGNLRPYEEMLADAASLTEQDIDGIGPLASEAYCLPPAQRELVLKAIKRSTGVSIAALREEGAAERDASQPRAQPDHLDLARSVIDKIGAENVICDAAGLWQWREKGVWELQEELLIKQSVQRVLEEAGESVFASKVSGVTQTIKGHAFVRDHNFNIGNPETINCLNGQLELDDFGWTLKPHNCADYRTTQIPVVYDDNAKAPLFEQFLEDIFRDDEDKQAKKQSLLEMIGYSLMAHARHEKFVILIGGGANGKSVLLAVLEALCGQANVAGVQPSNFEKPFQRAHLHGKLANIVTELKQGEVIADAELKAITSGEPATVERKYCTPFVMRPFATCWFGSNHMPHTRDFSDALFRRALIFRFGRTFSAAEQDHNLKDKLIAELPGILEMAIWAYAFALINGFTESPSSLEEKKSWRLEADQVAEFVGECTIADPASVVQIGELFRCYENWARENGIKLTLNMKNFRIRLTGLGYGAGPRRAGKTVIGLKIDLEAVGGF